MIGIIDCNNFYASCERSFNPALLNQPIVVFSNNDGAVIARSEEAKALGITMAAPVFKIKEMMKLKQIQGFSSNYTLYGDMSKRIKAITRNFFNAVEDYSIDESFVDCRSLQPPNPNLNLYNYVKDARDKITQWSGVPVSIGVGATKTLSKVANRIAKKQYRSIGVYVIDTEEKRIVALKNTDVNDVWGVGSRITAKLKAKGICNAYDLSVVDTNWAKANFSVLMQQTVYELQGISCLPLVLKVPNKQAIASQKSFGKFQTELAPIAEALANYTARVAEKLRKQKMLAGGIQVWLGTNNFSKTDSQYFPEINTLCNVPTDYTPYLISKANQALNAIYKKGYTYKRVGIMLTHLCPQTDGTLNLFYNQNRKREINIIKQFDKINRLNGRDTVRVAQQGFKADWRMKQENLSQFYTTRLSDIIEIK